MGEESPLQTEPILKLRAGTIEQMWRFPWFRNCGRAVENRFDPQPGTAALLDDYRSLAKRQHWANVKTEAQGELTGFLARRHYPDYATEWNRLVREATIELDRLVMSTVFAELQRIDALDFQKAVHLDLVRIVVHQSYQELDRMLPRFFGDLLEFYALGRLPCGWVGELADWPEGTVIVY